MDENRLYYDKRNLLKPMPYFAALKNEFNNQIEPEERPDYRIRQERDIDTEGIFLN